MVKILISYRRADSAAIAGRINDHLSSRYGAASVFMDIDAIPLGTDFRDAVRDFLREADILLVIVGPHWRGVREDGAVRLMDADDPVRVEIETALESKVPIVPLLVAGAIMPSPAELPESIAKFSFLNAAVVDIGRDFNFHITRVMSHLDQILAQRGKPQGKAQTQGKALARETVRLLGIRPALIGIAIVACLLLPLGGLWAHVSPPWPRGVAPITIAIEIAAIGFAFQMLKASRARTIHRVSIVALLALGIVLTGYLALVSYFTYETPATGQLWAKGFVCTPEATLVYKNKCPDLGIDELKDAEYEAERLWTARSVTTVRVSLVMSWLLGFLALGSLAGTFVAHQFQMIEGFGQAEKLQGGDG